MYLTDLTDHTESPGLSGAEWGENSHQGAHQTPCSPTMNCHRVKHGVQEEQELSPAGRQEQLQRGQDCDDGEEGENAVFKMKVETKLIVFVFA